MDVPSLEIVMGLSPSLVGKLGFLKPKFITKEIGDKPFNFYAVRVPMVAELLSLSGPIASNLSVLFSSDKNLRSIKQHENTIVDPASGANQRVIDSESPALPLDVIKHREESQKAAFKDLLDALVGTASNNLLARFVADSMRDERIESDEDAALFFNSLDIDVAMQFIAGALEANANVIRPFLGKAGLNLRAEATAAISEKLGRVVRLPGSPSNPPPSASESATTPSTSSDPSSSSS